MSTCVLFQHEAICAFPSEKFYDGELETAPSVKDRVNPETKLVGFWPQGPNLPIVFCNVVGEEGQSETGRQGQKKVGIDSKFNRTEAKKVVSYFEFYVPDMYPSGLYHSAIR